MSSIKQEGMYGHILIVLLIVTAALGVYLLPLFIAGIQLFAFRFLLAVTLLLLPWLSPDLSWRRLWAPRFYFLLGVIWLTWGVIGFLWTPDTADGARELIAVGTGFLIGFIFLTLKAYTDNGVLAIGWGWSAAFLATSLIALWEVVTGHHLPSYYTLHLPSYATPDITSTFGNPNNYGAFLVLAYPFLWLSYWLTRKTFWRWLPYLFILSTPVFLLLSASRLSMTGYLLQVLALGFVSLLHPRKHIVTLLTLVISVVLIGVVASNPTLKINKKIDVARKEVQINDNNKDSLSEPSKSTDAKEKESSKIDSGGATKSEPAKKIENKEPPAQRISAIQARINLTRNGIWMIGTTWGRGVGPGGFEYFHIHRLVPLPTNGIPNPHNFFIEIASQYGILVICLFFSWYVSLFYIAFKKRFTKTGLVLIMALLGYIPAAASNSSYIPQQINWVFLASVMILASHLIALAPRSKDA